MNGLCGCPQYAAAGGFRRQRSQRMFGPDILAAVDEPAMTAGRTSGYLQKFDGGFFWLGATKPGGLKFILHNTHFTVVKPACQSAIERWFPDPGQNEEKA